MLLAGIRCAEQREFLQNSGISRHSTPSTIKTEEEEARVHCLMSIRESDESSETSAAYSKRKYLTYKNKCKFQRKQQTKVEYIYDQPALSDRGSQAKENCWGQNTSSRENINYISSPYDDQFMRDNGVTFTDNFCESSSPIPTNDTERITSSMQISMKRSSGESLRNKLRAKKRADNEVIAELLIKHIETTEALKQAYNKQNKFTMTQCLTKLGNLPNISTAGVLAVQDALKDDNDNRAIFMRWDGDVLRTWIENIVASHPRYYSSSAWN